MMGCACATGRAKVTDRTEVTGIASRSPRFPASQDLQLVKKFLRKKMSTP